MESRFAPRLPGLGMIVACVFLLMGLTSACFSSPYFLIDSEMEWNEALTTNHIKQVLPGEWSDYMAQWNEPAWRDGPPYPPHEFLQARLYVYPGDHDPMGIYPDDAGLVMVWGDEAVPGDFASAWKYDYGLDPDLRNSIITMTVTAPQLDSLGNQMNAVSFGIQDINGNIRSWWWAVGLGQPIQWGVPTTITITTDTVGNSVATPTATSYVNNPAFNIVNSLSFIVDENGTWIGGPNPIPPPGQPGVLWNYWYNVLVTPQIQPKNMDPRKWSQPPVEVHPGQEVPWFYGWDERSMYYEGPPIVADDWECTDDRPITDIHWWGSFLGWTQPDIPAYLKPAGFHIGIWKDVPAGTSFSHPGELIWENFCYSYEWNFAGYDKDPLGRPEYENEACFQFFQRIPQAEWFYQDPGPDGRNVYWLSIAAIYSQTPLYNWGWKTRKHFWNDDAVRIWQVMNPLGQPWPPTRGAQWVYGEEIILGQESWDLSFELTTNRELPAEHDLGDAPDSTNSYSPTPMTAYPPGGPLGVQANYPTVYQIGSPPFGPLHLQPQAVAYLGAAVTLENEADIGPDQDPTNNIIPSTDSPDKDMADDGVTLPLVLPHCQGTSFNYTVTAVIPFDTIYVNVWFDWNRDGDWDDTLDCGVAPAPEWAVQNQPIVAPAAGVYTFTTPPFLPWHPTAALDPIWMRITLSEQQWQPGAGIIGDGGSGPAAGYNIGETEDYYFTPIAEKEKDWGDAPDGVAAPQYPTLAANNGANHGIVPGMFLGASIDSEANGQPNGTATGDDINNIDDEDGVAFVTAFVYGKTAMARVTASVNGFLDAWFDYNADGDWLDLSEQIVASIAVTAGSNNWITIPVGGGIQPGSTTFARFRFSSTGGLTPDGPAADGEVEDYEIKIEPEKHSKWVQPPDLAPTGMDVYAEQPRILADDFMCTESGPITFIRVWGSWYKDQIPPESAQPIIILSIHEDIPDPDGPGPEYSKPGRTLWWNSFTPGMGDFQYLWSPWASNLREGWYDPLQQIYDPNGDTICLRYDFQIPLDHAFIQRGTPESPKVYWLDVQAIDRTGSPEMYKFGWKSSVEHWNDDAVWGEGQEPNPLYWNEMRYPLGHDLVGQSVDLAFELRGEDLDCGDAQDSAAAPKYPTLLANNGASHDIVQGICLGSGIDRDPDGQPNAAADGDDTDPDGDDEDGVTFTTPLVPGMTAYIDVVANVPGYMSGWIDFNADGDWSDLDDYLWLGAVNAGSNVFPVWVPSTANGGQDTYARFRFGVISGGTETGHWTDGEVEDYKVYIQPNPAVVVKGRAKKLSVGVPVLLEQDIVTANFGQVGWYFEEPDRSAAFGVFRSDGTSSPWAIGDSVTCYGTTFLDPTTSCELMLNEIYSTWQGTSSVAPVGQNNRQSGGGPIYQELLPPPGVVTQPGLYDDVGVAKPAYGLNTVALLVKLWGRCTYIETDATGQQINFWIDDGSNLWDGTTKVTGEKVLGVKVKIATPIVLDKYYSAVGIMRTYSSSNYCVRYLWPRDGNDIVSYN